MKILLQKKKFIFINNNSFLFFYFLFIIICIISYFYSLEPAISVIKIRTLSLYFIFVATLLNYVDDYDKLRKLIKYFIHSGVIASFYILFDFLYNYGFSHFYRLGGVFGNVNTMGIIIGISTIFSFYFVLYERMCIYIFPIVITLILVLLTGSRTAFIFVLINIFFLIYFKFRGNLKNKIKSIILIVLILLLFYYLIFNVPIFYSLLGNRIDSYFRFFIGEEINEKSILLRDYMIRFGFEKFKEKPIFGWGIGNYEELFKKDIGYRGYAHNNYIELLVDVGIIGMVAYYLMYIFGLFKLKKLKIGKYENFKYLFISLFLSILIIGYSSVYYYDKHFYILLAMASVLIGSKCNEKNIIIESNEK